MLEPSAKVEEMEIEGTTAVKMKSYGRPLVSPDAFSGSTSWTDWIEHFEAVAVLNDWDDAAKLRWLPFRLSGKAQTAWKRLSPEVKADYEAAREALEKRFEPESKSSFYFVEFQARGRKEDTCSDLMSCGSGQIRCSLKLRTKQRNCLLLSVFSVSLLTPSRFDRGSQRL